MKMGWRNAYRYLLAFGLLAILAPAWSQTPPNYKATVTLVMTDAQGNILMTKDMQGNILARYTYRPYGTQQSGPTNAGPGYTGHVHDPATGLVYMQQRYYNPTVGRFLSPDPVAPTPGNVFNFGRYTYANDNPLRFTDPDGRCSDADGSCGRMVRKYGEWANAHPKAADKLGRTVGIPGVMAMLSITGIPEVASLTKVIGAVIKSGPTASKGVPKPSVTNSTLNNLVHDLYKGADAKKPIGTGSTADAIRAESATGTRVGGKFHTIKGQQYSNALEKWLQKNPNASRSDRQAAKSIYDDLKDALGDKHD